MRQSAPGYRQKKFFEAFPFRDEHTRAIVATALKRLAILSSAKTENWLCGTRCDPISGGKLLRGRSCELAFRLVLNARHHISGEILDQAVLLSKLDYRVTVFRASSANFFAPLPSPCFNLAMSNGTLVPFWQAGRSARRSIQACKFGSPSTSTPDHL